MDLETAKRPSEIVFNEGSEKNESNVTVGKVHHQLKGYWNPVYPAIEGQSMTSNLLAGTSENVGGREMAIALKAMKDSTWQKAKNRYKGEDEDKRGFNLWWIVIAAGVLTAIASAMAYYGVF